MMSVCDVIIVNYNAGYLLKEAVGSVLQVADTHVIVVDNASSDNSLDTLDRFNAEHITIIKNTSNQGFSAACNQGINASTATQLLFLNPDATIQPEALQRLISVLNSDNTIGMVGGLLVNDDGTEQGGGRRAMPTPWRLFVRATGLHHLKSWFPTIFYDFQTYSQNIF